MAILLPAYIGLLLTVGVMFATIAERSKNFRSFLLVALLSATAFAGAVLMLLEAIAQLSLR